MTQARLTFSTRRSLVGKAGPFPRFVFREEVMLGLEQFAHLHAKGEQGGFLIGRLRELNTAEQYEIVVERFVPIPQKDGASRLVIHESHLKAVERALRGGENPERVVGWAHTHPGFGTFLSDFDKGQHLRFFSQPWQIALVLDSENNESVAYRVVDGEWTKLGGYYILHEMAANETSATGGLFNSWARLILGVLALLLLIGAGSYAYKFIQSFSKPKSELTNFTVSQEEPVIVIETEGSQGQASPLKAVEANNTALPKQDPNTVISSPPENKLNEYVVQKGDTLWKIADKIWGDSGLFLLLIEENNLTEPNALKVGSVLRVPERPEN